MTTLRVVFYEMGDDGRWSWRLETARGNHATVVSSGTAYLTQASAQQGWQRFAKYLRDDAPIEGEAGRPS